MTLPADLARWGGTSRFADIDGPVHYVDFGGPANGPAIVLVHGLGGSHLNWCLLAPKLVPQSRVVAVDLAGFGLTHPRGRATTVSANVALLDRFIRQVVGDPVVLVGNSLGGMVSMLQAAEHPATVAGLVLVDPVLPAVAGVRPDRLVAATFFLYAVPGLGERYLARRRAIYPPRQLVRQVLSLCCVDPSVVPADLVDASVALVEERAREPGLDAAFLTAARSMLRLAGRRRAYTTAIRSIEADVLLLHGDRDRLVPLRAARAAAAANPHWRFETFANIGHVPQLEAPERTAHLILDWLNNKGRRHDDPNDHSALHRPGHGIR